MLQQKMSTMASSPQKYSCFSGVFQSFGFSKTIFSWCQCYFSAAQCWNRNCPKTHHVSFSTKPNKWRSAL